jgi:hypothetical protein
MENLEEIKEVLKEEVKEDEKKTPFQIHITRQAAIIGVSILIGLSIISLVAYYWNNICNLFWKETKEAKKNTQKSSKTV